MTSVTHPVDALPSSPKLIALGIQHVLAFYAGAVIVPLLIAGSLHLDAATTIHLINADLLTCGLATLIQSVGVGKYVGVRLPIIQESQQPRWLPLLRLASAFPMDRAALNLSPRCTAQSS